MSNVYLAVDPGRTCGIAAIYRDTIYGQTYKLKADYEERADEVEHILAGVMWELGDPEVEIRAAMLNTIVHGNRNLEAQYETIFAIRTALRRIAETEPERIYDKSCRKELFGSGKLTKPETHELLRAQFDLSHTDNKPDTLDAVVCALTLAQRDGYDISRLYK